MIAEANYGGRVTDPRDRDLVNVYAKDVFGDEVIAIEKWRPVDTQEFNFQYPLDETNIKPDQASFLQPDVYYNDIMSQMHEGIDPPIAFGQHANAEINAQIIETNDLLANIVALQPL